MRYSDLQLELLKMMKPFWDKVISLDLETHVINNQFLSNERILSISFARRICGSLLDKEGIEVKTIILEEDDDESEEYLLVNLNDEIEKIKPLCVTGYGIRYYDIPLLQLKRRKYNLKIWNIVDLIESTVHIDLYQLFKYNKYRKLADVLKSSEYANLPFRKTKNLVTDDRNTKAEEVYQLWKEDKQKLKDYNEGDVHDTLLLAEKLLADYLR